MVVRASLGEGIAVSFIIVALVVLGAFFLGWRLALGWQPLADATGASSAADRPERAASAHPCG